MENNKKIKNWHSTLKDFTKPSVIAMLFLGFSAGIPILLIFSSLSLWLREAGVSRAEVTFFSWAALGYSFKFVWAPLPDCLPIPILTRWLGRRRSWILLSQLAIIAAINIMAFTDPQSSDIALTIMALGAVLLGFSSATQDIVIDAYRIESDTSDMQALLSSSYIAGYRVGMIVAGAGALVLASSFGTSIGQYNYSAWRLTYMIMAATMVVGVITTLIIPEPKQAKNNQNYSTADYFKFFVLFLLIVISFIITFFITAEPAAVSQESLAEYTGNGLSGFLIGLLRLLLALGCSALTARALILAKLVNTGMVEKTYVEPVKDFFKRYGQKTAILLLLLVGFYRISDIVLGVISNVFYQDLGFSKAEIAGVVKTFGLIMTLAGGFLGGILTARYNIIKILFLGAVLSAATNILFIALAKIGANMPMLYLVISADNLCAGLASAAFIAFLSSLTNIAFTAVQYAIFSSLMTLFPKLLGGYSGTMAENLGYPGFFATTAIMGLPVLYIVWLVANRPEIHKPNLP